MEDNLKGFKKQSKPFEDNLKGFKQQKKPGTTKSGLKFESKASKKGTKDEISFQKGKDEFGKFKASDKKGKDEYGKSFSKASKKGKDFNAKGKAPV